MKAAPLLAALLAGAVALTAIAQTPADQPLSRTDQNSLTAHAHLLEKAIYEIGYELNNRPDWIKIPLQGVLQLLEEGEGQ